MSADTAPHRNEVAPEGVPPMVIPSKVIQSAAYGKTGHVDSCFSNEQDLVDVTIDPDHLSDTLKSLHSVRLSKLDDNSQQDFASGFKRWLTADAQAAAAAQQRDETLRARGHSLGATNLDYQECFDIMMQDPGYAARTRLQWSVHDLMWDRMMRALYGDVDQHLDALAESDNSGPGSLTLRPDLVIPDYARHEIHRQPGGFVGDAFAGWAYHYALTLAHYPGVNTFDEIFFRITQSHPLPQDRIVKRIIDIGCGAGQASTAFKQRFPEAEVWGLDLGGPMVRYAHHRAVKMNLDVHFVQALAEDMPFPDNHFDMVSDYLLFHETNREAMLKIIGEIFRVLRPGGVFGHLDAPTRGHPTQTPPNDIPGKAMLWNIYRNNYEPFYLDYSEFDLPSALIAAGFTVDLSGPPVLWNGRPRTLATKPA